MSIVKLPAFMRDGMLRMEAWALYVAFAPMDSRMTLVKVGISQNPFDRVYSVHCGSPFPVKRALWQYVGNKSAAHRAEKCALSCMAEKKTRGEWLLFQMDNPEDKELFHDSMRRSIRRATGKPPEWKEMDIKAAFAERGKSWNALRA